MMKTVIEYVFDASKQLNDQQAGREYTRWTRALLLSYLNEALAEISNAKPEAFAKQVSMTLVPGRLQKIDETITELQGARLVSLNKNVDGSDIYEADFDLQKAFAPFTCCVDELEIDVFGNPKFRVVSFGIDPKDTRSFFVSPAIPAGLSPVVNATVNGKPPRYTLGQLETIVDIEPKYEGSIMDYIIGKAFEIDNESRESARMADKHLGRFYTMLGVKYRYESAYRAGNWNGSVGDGDPRSRAQ